jgi:hypothetical protein
MKIQGDRRKHLLKQLAYRLVPRELLDRPKQGFGVPLTHWFRGSMRELFGDVVGSPRARQPGHFDAAFVPRVLKRRRVKLHDIVEPHPQYLRKPYLRVDRICFQAFFCLCHRDENCNRHRKGLFSRGLRTFLSSAHPGEAHFLRTHFLFKFAP